MHTRLMVAITLTLAGCASGKAALDWGGKEDDARLVSDVFTWPCSVAEVDEEGNETGETTTWAGVFAQTVTLEFAPDDLQNMELPSPGGCSADLDMFPQDAGTGAQDMPDLHDDPRWATDVDQGELSQLSTGYWKDNVFSDVHSCQYVEDVLSGGTSLTDADLLTGVTSPEPAEVPNVEFSGMSTDSSTGASYIDWGDEVVASWSSNSWDEVWVQIRRVREGEAWESVTCNATGMDSFTFDSTIWNLLDEDLQVEHNNIYVSFQNKDTSTTADSVKARTYTRATAVALIVD